MAQRKAQRKFPVLKQCYTVGQLIEELQRLPPDLQLGLESEEGVVLVPVNVNRPSECLDISYTDASAWVPGEWEPRG